MILHLVHDDKVVPRMISQFERTCPGNNIFLCVMRGCDNNQLTFLKDNPNVIKSGSDVEKNIPWKEINKICIHYLSFSKLRYLWKLGFKHNHLHKCKIIWFIWGGDIFEILERKGFKLYSDNNSFLQIRKSNIKTEKSFDFRLTGVLTRILENVSYFARCHFIDKRIDYILCSSKYLYELYSSYINFSSCKELLNYSYYPIEDTLGSLFGMEVKGNSIIIGNSASESNNHEYVLDYIENINLGNRIIYVPLSYGKDTAYIKIIEEKYSKLPNTVILKEFLPLEEYHKLLINCSTFIYGNFRPEAWGNILVALYLGGKVYISEKSVYSKSLKAAGYKFFITEEIKDTYNIELTEDEKKNNRRIAMETSSREINKKNIEYINNL